MQTSDLEISAPETDTAEESRYDWSRYLRRITFLDTTPDKPGAPPVHVTQSLLLDGVEHRELVDPRFGWTVSAAGIAESLVSFVANAEYVEMGEVIGHRADGQQIIKDRALCGIPVLTPPQEDHPWEVLTEDEVRSVNDEWAGVFGLFPRDEENPLYEVRGYKIYPYARQAEPPKLIRVCVQVREIEVTAAPDPAQASIAQAVGEAIGEASMCWSETPTGVFDSTRASGIVDRLLARLRRAAAPSHAAGDRMTDGGIVGTLVRCEQCGGGGLLHQADEGAMPVSPEPLGEVDA